MADDEVATPCVMSGGGKARRFFRPWLSAWQKGTGPFGPVPFCNLRWRLIQEVLESVIASWAVGSRFGRPIDVGDCF